MGIGIFNRVINTDRINAGDAGLHLNLWVMNPGFII